MRESRNVLRVILVTRAVKKRNLFITGMCRSENLFVNFHTSPCPALYGVTVCQHVTCIFCSMLHVRQNVYVSFICLNHGCQVVSSPGLNIASTQSAVPWHLRPAALPFSYVCNSWFSSLSDHLASKAVRKLSLCTLSSRHTTCHVLPLVHIILISAHVA